MGGKPAVHGEPVGSLDALIEPQRGDAEDFVERGFVLGRRVVVADGARTGAGSNPCCAAARRR